MSFRSFPYFRIDFIFCLISLSLVPKHIINAQINIKISGGELEGRVIRSEKSGIEGFGFLGIPYAEPPIGRLRFENPVPKKPWSGTLETKEYKAACWQNATISPQDLISEDCLYVNVLTSPLCKSADARCPVLVHVHGGGYEFDSVRMYKPEVLVENFVSRGIIFVNFGYRLNVFGFWSTGSESAEGNWGLQDMIEVLKWVQKEIHHFGGDKSKVTILGHSSSADSVNLLIVSPKTEGLFDQALIMSGAGGHTLNNNLTDYRDVAIALGCADREKWSQPSQHKSIIECMKNIDTGVLGNTFLSLRIDSTSTTNAGQLYRFIHKEKLNIELPLRVVGPRNDGPQGLFPDPFDLMLARRRPIKTLLGTTVNECGGLNYGFPKPSPFSVAQMCEFLFPKNGGHKKRREFVRACKINYVLSAGFHEQEREYSKSNFSFWSRLQTSMYSDRGQHARTYREVHSLLSTNSTVYLYNFEYERKNLEGVSPWHSMDLTYLTDIHSFPFDEFDNEIQKIYIQLFANYVKYRNPTPPSDIMSSRDQKDSQILKGVTWLPVEPDGTNFLSIDLRPRMKKHYYKNAVWFWNHIVKNIEGEKVCVVKNRDKYAYII